MIVDKNYKYKKELDLLQKIFYMFCIYYNNTYLFPPNIYYEK